MATKESTLVTLAGTIGEQVAKLVETNLSQFSGGGALFSDAARAETVLRELVQNRWSDNAAVLVLQKYLTLIAAGRAVDPSSFGQWLRYHAEDTEAVIDCLDLETPAEIDVVFKRLPKTGSQKQVFLAQWKTNRRRVVLKKILGPSEVVERIRERESKSHPLSLEGPHENIVPSYVVRNKRGEPFLVEQEVKVLDDSWEPKGYQEVANVFYDIAKAVRYLNEQDLVHSDIKPDNIGWDQRFVLLDFGICRSVRDYSPETTPSGSLRTRPPELLGASSVPHPAKHDVWALGATVFKGLFKRYPLIKSDERVPRISVPGERLDFEQMLKGRADKEWALWVPAEQIPGPFREPLLAALEPDANKRIDINRLVDIIEKQLSAYLPSSGDTARFSALDSLRQLALYGLDEVSFALAPHARKEAVRKKLDQIERAHGLDEGQKRAVSELRRTLFGAG
jgi:serine/threonine protein kinase